MVMALGEQIRQARENKNLSQEALADMLGVSRQAVSKWENNSSLPQGLNRETLSQVLELEVPTSEDAPVVKKRSKVLFWLGWILAAALLWLSIGIGLQLRSMQQNTQPAPSASQWALANPSSTPAIKSIQFYDKDKNIVLAEALWYNAAEIDSILIEWEGGTPASIRMFSTPTGTEMMENTELLLTKGIPDGDTAALLNADALKTISMGHVSFELYFTETTVWSDTYNMFYDAVT